MSESQDVKKEARGWESNLELCIYYAKVCVGGDGVKKGELSV